MADPDKSLQHKADEAHWRPDKLTDGARPRPRDGGDDHRTMALLTWALLLAGIVTFLAGVIAAVVAYAKRGDAPEPWRSHYDAAIRMFWIWLLLVIIGAPLTWLLGLGYLILAVAAIWTAAVGVRGLFRASENRPA